MKRRPTIPLFKWRIATHLERTREIQNREGMPAYQCKCELCEEWKCVFKDEILAQTKHELQRLGVQLDAPDELYGYPKKERARHVRAIYHIVGKVLSGPETVIFHKTLDDHVQSYVTIRESPWFSVRVLNANESYELSPVINDENDGDIIVLDFRFDL